MSKSHRAKSAPARRRSRKRNRSRKHLKSAPGKMQPHAVWKELFEKRKRKALRLRRPLKKREDITGAMRRLSMGGKSRRKPRRSRRPRRKSDGGCWLDYIA